MRINPYKFANKEELVESDVDKTSTLTNQFSNVFTLDIDKPYNVSSKQFLHRHSSDIAFIFFIFFFLPF